MNYSPTMIHALVQRTDLQESRVALQNRLEKDIMLDKIETFKNLREFGIPSSHAKGVFE